MLYVFMVTISLEMVACKLWVKKTIEWTAKDIPEIHKVTVPHNSMIHHWQSGMAQVGD